MIILNKFFKNIIFGENLLKLSPGDLIKNLYLKTIFKAYPLFHKYNSNNKS